MKCKMLLSLISLTVISCGSAPDFDWHPDIYVGDSQSQSVQGANENIRCADPKFDDLVCVHKDEPRKAVEAAQNVINKCEKWAQ